MDCVEQYKCSFLNGMCRIGRLVDAQSILDVILQKAFKIDGICYVELIHKLCEDEKLDKEKTIFNRIMIEKGYIFYPTKYVPLINTYDKLGKIYEINKVAEVMMDMAIRHDEINERIVSQSQEDSSFGENN